MKNLLFPLFLLCCSAAAQPQLPYKLPQYAVPQKLFGSGPPAYIPGNLPGDLYLDKANHKEYVCSAPQETRAPACSMVAPGNWSLITTGAAGAAGATGATGPAGLLLWFPYQADTGSTAANDPGSGSLRWNNITHSSATMLYFDWLTTDGFDATALYLALRPPVWIVIQDKNLAINHEIFEMTAPIQVNPDWFQMPVRFVSSSGNPVKAKPNPIAVLIMSPQTTTTRGTGR
jgi:hypothetical protein